MQGQIDFTRLRQGMDVFDRNDEKIGTVNKVHMPAGVTPTAGRAAGAPMGAAEGVIQVDTGFLGLGKDLYIPFSAIRDIRGDGVYLNVDKRSIDQMGWDKKPTWLT